VAVELMGDHLSSCMSEAIEAEGPGATEKIAETTDAIASLIRSSPTPRICPTGLRAVGRGLATGRPAPATSRSAQAAPGIGR
jgi:hypothetical protein